MKIKTLIPVFLFVFLALEHPLGARESNDKVNNEISQILDQWHHDAAVGNHETYIGAMSSDGVFIGTDPSERWTTSEFRVWSKPFFDKKRTWDFRVVSRNIVAGDDGLVAWFDELLETQMGICRGSGILIKREGKWKIEQYVLSATIPNALMQNITAQKKVADSLRVPYLKNNIKDPEKSLGLKAIFDKYAMNGTIMIYDPTKNEFGGYNPSRWDSGYLPASTFKIPNTLISLETGVIDTRHIFRWNGEKRRLTQWEKDLTLQEAFRVSCVPCFQELARKTGAERMVSYLQKLQYPGMDVHPENIDLFWLEGNSRITPRQQVSFMQRLYREELPLAKSTMKAVKEIMVNEETPDYKLSGKTGWAIRNGNNYGWFVGWIETQGKAYFIATLVEPRNQDNIDDFAIARKTVTMEALKQLRLIN